MNKAEINTVVKHIVSENLDINAHFVTRNRHLANDLGADSLNLVEIVIDIERKLNVSIDDYLLCEVKTVGDLIDVTADVKLSFRGERMMNISCCGGI